MSLSLLALLVLVFLGLGYRFYGRLVARVFVPDDTRPTPAVEQEDGVDFVPTRPFYLLGQHFSAISAAGPIAGPILACQMFGWLPCVLWIGIGVVFIGAVHDFSSLMASVRHRGRSVAEIAREHLGRRAWLVFMLFIWIALVYVIVAFADITATTFVGATSTSPKGDSFNPGGAVAGASILYLLLSVAMGLVQRRWDPPLWLVTVLFVPAALGAVWLGTQISTVFVLDVSHPAKVWGLLILAYCLVASLVPIWSLLQPRGYLGGFILYIVLFVGIVGIFSGRFPLQQEAFKTWVAHPGDGEGIPLMPFLFVTIACGACSGFHGLVCSGTTSKQIRSESHCRPVGYGGMLLEGFVALIALATIAMVAQGQASGSPGRIYGDGIGRFLTVIIGENRLLFATTFGAMAFSTFVFDTLDVSTRLGRYILQELFRVRGKVSGIVATLVTLVPPLLFLVSAPAPGPGQRPAYMYFWTLFGTSNQLLAALTLLGVTVWLFRTRRPVWYTLFPTLFVLGVTLYALVLQVAASFRRMAEKGLALDPVTLNGVVGLLLCALALTLIVEAVRSVWRARHTWRLAGRDTEIPPEPAQ